MKTVFLYGLYMTAILLLIASGMAFSYQNEGGWSSDQPGVAHGGVSAVNVDTAIQSSLKFLKTVQRPFGEFPSVICNEKDLIVCEQDYSPFPTTFVMDVLVRIEGEAAVSMVENGLRYLLSLIEPGHLWRYWTPSSPRRDIVTPDLDVTACVRAVLILYGKRLSWDFTTFSRNQTPQGAFYTWTQMAPRFNVIDCAVNANILYYFTLERAIPVSLVDFLEKNLSISRVRASNVFYETPLAFYYHMARAIRAEPKLKSLSYPIIKEVMTLRRPDGSFGNTLESALAAATLVMLKTHVGKIERQAVKHVLSHQLANGGFPQSAFYHGPQGCTTTCRYFGSEALTTAIALDALQTYREQATLR